MSNVNLTPPPQWICERQIPTPQTKDGCAPAITATYEYASFANMVSTAHFPRCGVIEIGVYGLNGEDRRKDEQQNH